MVDLFNQTYTAQTVALATGATAKQITDWTNQGLIIGQNKRPGRGRAREFSWFNVMEVAAAMALMEIGIRSPADAFRFAQHFAHFGDGGGGWVGRDDGEPERLPGVPFHHGRGRTILCVAGGEAHIALVRHRKPFDLEALRWSLGRPIAMIVLDVTEIFRAVTLRMSLDYGEVLDAVYSDTVEG